MSLLSEVSVFKREVRATNAKLDRVVELLEQVVELLEDHQEPPPSYTFMAEGWLPSEEDE